MKKNIKVITLWLLLAQNLGLLASEKKTSTQMSSSKVWSAEEIQRLVNIVENNMILFKIFDYKQISWARISSTFRCKTLGFFWPNAKQCRESWLKHVHPALKADPFSPEEESLLLQLKTKSKQRKSWAELEAYFNGRSESALRNLWNSPRFRKFYNLPSIKEKIKAIPAAAATSAVKLRPKYSRKKNTDFTLEAMDQEQAQEFKKTPAKINFKDFLLFENPPLFLAELGSAIDLGHRPSKAKISEDDWYQDFLERSEICSPPSNPFCD